MAATLFLLFLSLWRNKTPGSTGGDKELQQSIKTSWYNSGGLAAASLK